MSKLIGMTGPTGSGKSSAAALAAQCGIKVVDCDVLARRAVLPETAGLAALTAAFGRSILCENGTLNRKALASEAFVSPEKTALLNQTLLPHIAALVRAEIDADAVLLDAPTLFESGLDAICDDTVAVLANEKTRLARIIARDGLTLKEAKMRLHAGKPDTFYLERAGHILYNDTDSDTFLAGFRAIINQIYGGISL